MIRTAQEKLLNLIDRMRKAGFNSLPLEKDYERKYGVKLYSELSAPTVIKRIPNQHMAGFRVGASARED